MNKIVFTYKKDILFLFLLLFFASLLRFYNFNWDSGHFFHPDERNIANAVSHIHFFDQLNPDFFAYGGFSIYLYRAIGEILVYLTKNTSWVADWGLINIIGRLSSAFFSTITIVPIYLLAKKIFNQKVAVLSALFATFTVSFIQTAHYAITENIITLLSVTLCLFSIFLYENSKSKWYIHAGIILGIAIATKTTALSLLIFPLTAHVLTLMKQPFKKILKQNIYFLFLLIISFLTFILFSPYTFLDWDKFMESMHYESGVAIGTLPVVYTYQFNHTPAYLYQLVNFIWQLGPIAIFTIPAFLFLLFHIFVKKDKKAIILLLFPMIYFFYVGSWHTKFIRYMVPILPFIIIFISYFLVFIYTQKKLLGTCLIAILIALSLFWSVSFFTIYTRPQTRIAASYWIYQHIPTNSKILGEHWDDGLPIPLQDVPIRSYAVEQLTIYDQDNEMKREYYADKLSSGDYIIINSRRLYGTLLHLPDQYPITSNYYKLLFSNKLGYEKIAEFTSYPSLLGITINDDLSEETFQVYEHPKVIIFKNEKHFSYDTLLNLL